MIMAMSAKLGNEELLLKKTYLDILQKFKKQSLNKIIMSEIQKVRRN